MIQLLILASPFILAIFAIKAKITKKAQLNSLSSEEKETLEIAKEKIANLKKGHDLATKIIITIGIIITVLFWGKVILEEFVIKQPVQPTPVYDMFGMPEPHFCFSIFLRSYLSLLILYLAGYIISRIIIETLFMKKISKNTELLTREKELLKLYYGKKIMPIVFWSFLIGLVSIIYQIISQTADKPIIYLYPEKEEKVKVKLSKKECITHSYPKYKDEWNVTAKPDGTLVDEDLNEYYALYYESKYNCTLDKKIGFCVKGEDTIRFLEEKLEKLGLNSREKEEFIIYWLPKMENNPYNYIYFKTEHEVDEIMGLDITPKPDTIVRVLMCFKPLNKKVDVKEQEIITPVRKGFTVVEWGGTQL